MDMEGLRCHGCGSTNVEFNPKRRVLYCHQCGKEEYYSRATLNANGKVIFSRQNAMRFFEEGKLDDARHYAMDVLNISSDNAPARFILAYHDEFKAMRPKAMKQFFEEIQTVALEYDEVVDLRRLLLLTACNLGEFEGDVIQLLAANMQSQEDVKPLCEFIDTFCPYQIGRRTSASFLTKQLCEMYQDLTDHCGIPKTCFALLKGIETNPDSPYASNSFYLKAKAKAFYDHYVADVGKIIKCMPDSPIKTKFIGAYQSICLKYKKDAGIA